MRPRSATFLTSATAPAHFPAPRYPEIAFAGRSNVGKSSLINTLVDVPKLARTSSTPGRTRLINWFEVVLPNRGDTLYFVDLPGYGYAKVSKAMRASWQPLIESYLDQRQPLRALVLLIDARRGAETEERELVSWLGERDVRTIVALTKVDKLPKNKRKPAGFALAKELGLTRQPVLVSAVSGEGLDELWRAIVAASRPPRPGKAPDAGS